MTSVIEHHPLRKTMSVLVVEDERRLRELLVDAIADMGFATAGVRSGEDAIEAMAVSPSEIVMLDLNLPQMSGLDCAEQMKRRWPLTQTIVLTAYGDLPAAQRAIHLEVVEFLTKPCPLGEVERALARARQARLGQAMRAIPEMGMTDESVSTLEAAERNAIRAALKRNGGNRKAAANELGISRRTLHYRLSRYREQGEALD